MQQLNKVTLVGYVGNVRINELTETRAARFTVMTSITYKGQDGVVIESTWHNCTAFESNKLSLAGLEKGAAVKVEGRIRNSRYTDVNGNERTIIEIIVKELEILNVKTLETEE